MALDPWGWRLRGLSRWRRRQQLEGGETAGFGSGALSGYARTQRRHRTHAQESSRPPRRPQNPAPPHHSIIMTRKKLKHPPKTGITGQNYPPSRASLVLEEHQMLPAQPVVFARQPHVTLVAHGGRRSRPGHCMYHRLRIVSAPCHARPPRGRGAPVKT